MKDSISPFTTKPKVARYATISRISPALLLALSFQAGAQEPKPADETTDDAAAPDTVTVTAQKQPENLQNLPLSDTVVTKKTIEDAGIRSINEASVYAPNVFINEFSARKLSNPRFRGIGSSPNNPGVTTYIDGVPQLNANSSSLELLDVDQIEFVRGPQGALFGRNTVGGLISITSTRPSLWKSSGDFIGTLGNHSFGDLRGSYSAPLKEGILGYRLGFGYSRRDGYTKNDVTGNTLDDRGAFFGKGQLLWKPAKNREVRLLLTGERARDGDYALNDLAATRANRFHVSRDFEGFTNRDILAPTLIASQYGKKIDMTLISGLVNWKTEDSTDLDYTPLPFATRNNKERDTQISHELRLASAKNAPLRLSENLSLKWQAGVSYFKQNYDQDAFNVLNPPIGPLPGFESHSQAALNDSGIGAYGQATFTAKEKLDFIVGVRGDYERKKALLTAFTNPAFGPPNVQNLKDSFSETTPQFGVAYRLTPSHLLYGTFSQGFKAGGFNPASPAGTELYGQEKSRNYEIGAKTSWLSDRLTANFAAYKIDWQNLQLNVPFGAPGQFFIDNVGNASSKGVELELNARPRPGLDLFAGGGLMNARFSNGSTSGGANVGGNKLPFSPNYTANAGVQYSRAMGKDRTFYGRAEAILYGNYRYDDQNMAGQSAYTIANFRAGVRSEKWFAEGWLRNAFNTNYVPIALPYPGLAPSGFIGEPGAPMTFGLSIGRRF